MGKDLKKRGQGGIKEENWLHGILLLREEKLLAKEFLKMDPVYTGIIIMLIMVVKELNKNKQSLRTQRKEDRFAEWIRIRALLSGARSSCCCNPCKCMKNYTCYLAWSRGSISGCIWISHTCNGSWDAWLTSWELSWSWWTRWTWWRDGLRLKKCQCYQNLLGRSGKLENPPTIGQKDQLNCGFPLQKSSNFCSFVLIINTTSIPELNTNHQIKYFLVISSHYLGNTLF